ncbi:MAG TPA: TetR/AcrR family transcriptional regulator [Acidimicrobiia bacterium]|nr:TetR/AcrR family transcriptional regulator [Acidimicrobiia bacterium]
MATTDPQLRERLLEAAYACVARFGMGKTTIDDVVKESSVSRATIYRAFPGGKDELMREVVAWEMGRFFGSLAEAVAGAPDFATLVEEGLVFAHRAVLEHEVLQKVLVTEPERLLPLLTTETHRPLRFITGYLVPFLEREEREGRVWPGLDLERAADYVARMLLSLIGSPGQWDLDDPVQVHELVRTELLAGVLVPEALA